MKQTTITLDLLLQSEQMKEHIKNKFSREKEMKQHVKTVQNYFRLK